MTNPSQFIDDIFSGIVQFIFNIVDSLRILLTNPLRGTLRLTARYKHNKSPQISYITILFLLNLASYLLYQIFEVSFPAVANTLFLNLRGDAVTHLLIYATAATALQQWWIASLYSLQPLASPKALRSKLLH
jgi:hypothetical protein